MATKKKFDPGFVPFTKGDMETMGRDSLSEGKCELKRVDRAGEVLGEQTLALVFSPEGWGYPLAVYLGEDVPGFTRETPWEEILKTPVDSKFMWLGKNYKASVRLGGGGTAVVEVREPLGTMGFRKNPFASFRVKLEEAVAEERPETSGDDGNLYAVSVASLWEGSGTLTSHCDVFGSAVEAADWFERDWNDQAAHYGGKRLGKKAKKKFLESLRDGDGIADAENPPGWGAWFKWHAVRKTV